MANNIVLRVRDSQIEGKLVKNAFPVADSVGKVRLGYFVTVSDTETSAEREGRATIVYADATRKPLSLVYKTTLKDQYGRRDDLTSDDDYFYAVGERESKGLALIKEFAVDIQSKTVADYRHFASKKAVILASGAVAAGGILTDATVAAAVKKGDKLTAGTEVVFVKAIAGNAVTLVLEAGTAASTQAGVAIAKRGQIGDALYFNPAQVNAANGIVEELPVLTYKTNTTDVAIGYVTDVDQYIIKL